jgi:hypothetical protein
MTDSTNPPQPETAPIVEGESSGEAILDFAVNQLKSFGLTIWDMLKDLLIFIVDTVMTGGIVILEGFSSAFQLLDLSTFLSSMPPEVTYVFSATGLGTALGIVMTAGAARLLMQLIPFVRLGS